MFKPFFEKLRQAGSGNLFLGGRPLPVVIATVALLAYAGCGAVMSDTTDTVRHVLLLVALWGFSAGPRALRNSAAFWLLALACAIPLASWALSLLTHPQWAENSPKVHRLTNLLGGIPVAYALGTQTWRSRWMWLIAGAALLLAPWLSGGGWAEIARGLQGQRIDFALHNAEHAGLYYATLGLGLLAALPWILKMNERRWLVLLLWLVAISAALVGILLVQTRSMWLGLFAALLLMGGLKGFQLIRHTTYRWLSAAALALATVPLFVLFLNLNIVERRVTDEAGTIESLLSGNRAAIPFDSTGVRVHSWLASLDWIAQRPLLGWGGRGRSLVIAQSAQFPEAIKPRYRHLHNSYLDVTTNYGLAGLALLLALWGWLIRIARQATRSGDLSPEMLHFFLCFMLLWAIVNSFESFVFFSSGVYVFSLISGYILSRHWRATLRAAAAGTTVEQARDDHRETIDMSDNRHE